MLIEISIINSPQSVSVSNKSQTFPKEGGSLGRATSNFWVLDDPNKYMSSVHAQISVIGDQFYITDTSTNGTFINGNAEPLGKGNKSPLNQGDTFSISDYEFLVSIPNSPSAIDPFALPENNLPQAQSDPFSAPISNNALTDPFASSSNSNPFGEIPEDPFAPINNDPFQSSGITPTKNDPFSSDPLDIIPDAARPVDPQIPDDFLGFGGTEVDDSPIQDAISWPEIKQEEANNPGMIPDDWDNLDLSLPVQAESNAFTGAVPSSNAAQQVIPEQNHAQDLSTPANTISSSVIPSATNEELQTLKQENSALNAEIQQLKALLANEQAKKESVNTQSVPGDGQQVLINAMGLEKWNLPPEKVTEIHQVVGLLMREMMNGMMRVLKFRKKIKEEFRINVTTIQSVENNPLKFSANIDDAMENMFIKENNAYKAPLDAVREGFEGIAEHQVAVIAGMQAAFRGMIDRFEPTNLENRFEKYKSSSFLTLGEKRKRWNAYKEYHQGLVENLDDSFQHLFGYDFVQAYEEQMHKLVSDRLSPSKSNEKI